MSFTLTLTYQRFTYEIYDIEDFKIVFLILNCEDYRVGSLIEDHS